MQISAQKVAQWDRVELTLRGPDSDISFTECLVYGRFTNGTLTVKVQGFYDGDGVYKIRFMPHLLGQWQVETFSWTPELTGKRAAFTCTAARSENHGPVRVVNKTRLAYADGTPYFATGTTSYSWAFQDTALVEQTLESLKNSPFNKLRMCLTPKWYEYVTNTPRSFPFERNEDGGWDFTRFNLEYFRDFETLIGRLRQMGIEAEIILFHPYDNQQEWGFSHMPREVDHRLLRYAMARLSAYPNIWWCAANEWHYMGKKTREDFETILKIITAEDHAGHLRTMHGGWNFGDDTTTHVCIGEVPADKVDKYRSIGKPQVWDEFGYEGDLPYGWGNRSAHSLVHELWLASCGGGYPAAHSECFSNKEEIMWWPKGGTLKGQSVPRIGFLKEIFYDAPLSDLEPCQDLVPGNAQARLRSRDGSFFLAYMGTSQPAFYRIPLSEDRAFVAEVIDVWEMTVEPVAGTFSGIAEIPLPGKPYCALRIRAQRSGR